MAWKQVDIRNLLVFKNLRLCHGINVYMCLPISLSLYVGIYVFTTFMYVCVHLFIYFYVSVYVLHIYLHICVYASIYMFVCICLCTYICMYLCMYAYVYYIYVCNCLCVHLSRYIRTCLFMNKCYVHIYIYVAIIYVCIYLSIYVCVFLCIHLSVCVYVFPYISVSSHLFMPLCIYMYHYVCVYIYISRMFVCILYIYNVVVYIHWYWILTALIHVTISEYTHTGVHFGCVIQRIWCHTHNSNRCVEICQFFSLWDCRSKPILGGTNNLDFWKGVPLSFLIRMASLYWGQERTVWERLDKMFLKSEMIGTLAGGSLSALLVPRMWFFTGWAHLEPMTLEDFSGISVAGSHY